MQEKYEIIIDGKPYKVRMKVKDQVRINKRFSDGKMTQEEYALYMIWKVWYAIKPRFIFRPWFFLYAFIMNCDIQEVTRAFYVVEAYEKNLPVSVYKKIMAEDQKNTIEALKKKQEVRAEMVLGRLEEVKQQLSSLHRNNVDSQKLQ